MRFLLLALLALGFPAWSPAQNSRAQPPPASRVQQLYGAGRYAEIVALVPASPANSPELDLYRGLALARLGRWPEARAAFEAAHAQQPANARFLVELAGAAYKMNDSRAAKRSLRRALRLAPDDRYARNFLASLYFLDGNLEAALAEWNRIDQPRIIAVDRSPQPRLRGVLLDRAFAFASLETLRLGDLRATEARLDNLGVFASYRFELAPVASDNYSVTFHSLERSGWGAGKLDGLLSLVRGLPYLTVEPGFYNLHDAAINVSSLLRWDDNKRRVTVAVSGPLGGDPRWRAGIHFDARNENWDLSRTFRGPSGSLANLNLEKIEIGPEFRAVESGRWGWQAGVVYAYRRFRNVAALAPAAAPFFTSGGSLEYRARTDYRILDNPGRRLRVDSGVAAEYGRNFARGLGGFGATTGAVELRWLPRARGDDYQTSLQFRAGRAYGFATLDQLYQLGVERDNDLWLRGVAGTRRGRKGSAPLGREYALWNWETDKTLYQNGLIEFRLGPFLDAGRVADPSGLVGSSGWLWDPGLALTVRVLGSVSVVLSYGRDIGSGRGAFYATSTR
ncbi:MAG TPA: tetratricopeptide repeat protein [Candidatus Acidoferrales bacterium]|nr:tetratricopeptide repeat protein [Candidatus Acidoferrales bacterium]